MSAPRGSIYLKRRGGLRAWLNSGDAMIWLSGAAVSLSVIAVVGLIALLAWHGLGYFWPRELILYETSDGQVLGEQVARETVAREQLVAAGWELESTKLRQSRLLVKRGNREFFETDFTWLLESRVTEVTPPADAVRVERLEWGNLYGYLDSVSEGGAVVADASLDFDATWVLFTELAKRCSDLRGEIRELERSEVGRISRAMERLRLEQRSRVMRDLPPSTPALTERSRELEASYQRTRGELLRLYAELDRYSYRMRLADGRLVDLPLGKVVRAIRPNDMNGLEKIAYYGERLWEFLSDEPREANTEGGVYPAIFGTVMMVLLMSVIVTPFGVLAAVYLHEVARQGRMTRIFRAAVNNLAGVPSIVYGIFGLGFFVYGLGGELDSLFFPEALPSPTFGTPGIMWASLTLALLTLPVVIVATEEGLARIPRSIREGSLALGALFCLWPVLR